MDTGFETILQIAKPAISIFLAANIIRWWSRKNYDAQPVGCLEESGMISPGKIITALVTFVGILIGILGVVLMTFEIWLIGSMLLIFGSLMSIFMAASFSQTHNVIWDEVAVSGPCKLFGPTLGRTRTTISWSEVISTGRTASAYWFIEAGDGRRIYWSYFYPRYGRFVKMLQVQRPEITLPPDIP